METEQPTKALTEEELRRKEYDVVTVSFAVLILAFSDFIKKDRNGTAIAELVGIPQGAVSFIATCDNATRQQVIEKLLSGNEMSHS